MRTTLLVAVLVAACRSPAPPSGRLAGGITEDARAVHVHYAGREVPLQELPIAAHLWGLPMSGLADIAIDLVVPIASGRRQYHAARGSIDLACPHGCTIGNDTARLVAPPGEFPDGEIVFGRIGLEHARVRIDVRDGRARITRWELRSNDLTLELAAELDLADRLEDSSIRGCIAFAGGKALEARAPRTYALLGLTGAELEADHLYHVALSGTLAAMKRLSASCDPSPR